MPGNCCQHFGTQIYASLPGGSPRVPSRTRRLSQRATEEAAAAAEEASRRAQSSKNHRRRHVARSPESSDEEPGRNREPEPEPRLPPLPPAKEKDIPTQFPMRERRGDN